jgi:6-phosphogluconolactonase
VQRVIVEDPAAEAAERIAKVVVAGGNIALAGGSTPRAAYERLSAMGLDWSSCRLWFGDERCVPPDDERSNYRMAHESLLEPLGDSAPEAHRIEGELGPDAAAKRYQAELTDALGDQRPQLDLLLLGIGPDGHTASLFPGKPALDELDRAVVGVPEAGQPPYVPRVTLTLPVLNAAREVLFLIKGAEKAGPAASAFGDDPDPALPASLVRPRSGRLTILLDRDAAGSWAS